MSTVMFRSEEMSYIQLYIPMEIAQQTTAELGDVGFVQFVDMNKDTNAFQRAYVNEIRRIDEMERELRFLENQLEKTEIKPKPLLAIQQYGLTRTQQEIDELEHRLGELVQRLEQMNESQETLNKRFLELTELRHVLRESAVSFEEAGRKTDDIIGRNSTEDSHLLGRPVEFETDMDVIERGGGEGRLGIGFIAGVVPRARMDVFRRILWRLSRGNCFMNFSEIDEQVTDPVTDEVVQKNVFIVFAHGKELLAKLRKACDGMGATIYPVDERAEKRREDALEVITRLEDLKHVLDNTKNTRRAELYKVAENYNVWNTILKKEKALYHQLNLFTYDLNRKALIGEGWCPTASLGTVQYALRSVQERTGSTVAPLLSELSTTKIPPTYHRTNKFTKGFQAIIDSYGMASYREVNPGLFTVITFPFLFAVMFGDTGHGAIMFLFALWMVLKEKQLLSKDWGEIWNMFFSGRYILLLMGAFSVFTGLIYNDIFSQAMSIFSSGYNFVPYKNDETKEIGERKWTYALGIDPAWHGTENALLFLNSYKMKMAIVMGVIHMTFGISMNFFNHRHFKRPHFILFETIPQMIFLLSLFGYLSVLIIYKWVNEWPGGQCPGLLNTLIYMFLSPGNVKNEDQLYPGQATIQLILVLIAVVCVPWMLLVKPFYLKKEANKHRELGYANVVATPHQGESAPSSPVEESHGHGGHGEHFEFSEVMIHQMIHTIEFCLGAISNTASYLRLWALSLAHNQLSVVLWDMVLGGVLGMSGPIGPIAIVIGFAAWACLTVGILIVMEGLSAFLHALRLHWVEFNGKFYEGQGYAFIPFSFARLMQGGGEASD